MASFWTIQKLAVSTVRNQLGQSLRENQTWMSRPHVKAQAQNVHFDPTVTAAFLKIGGIATDIRSAGKSARRLAQGYDLV